MCRDEWHARFWGYPAAFAAGAGFAPGSALASAGCLQMPNRQARRAAAAQPRIGYANIGRYLLTYKCAGHGRTTVMLEAGYTASGIDTYGRTILSALARRGTTGLAGPGRGSG